MTEQILYAVLYEKLKKSRNGEKINIKIYDTVDSTNSEAKRYADKAVDRTPTLFIAKEQTSGRGRVGRSFLSREGHGIYMTLLYFTEESLGDIVSVTTSAAVAVALSIEAVTGEKVRIKWVNDIYNDLGKVSGILVETKAVELGYAVAVGVGINIGKADFPEELRSVAASIGDICGREEELVANVCDRLLTFAAMPRDRGYMKEYRERFMLEGKYVSVISVDGDERLCGRVMGVTDDGGLVVETDGGTETVRSGSLSVRIKEIF